MIELIETGLLLTVAGMGLVFLLLALLWGLIALLLRLDRGATSAPPADAPAALPASVPAAVAPGLAPELLAAITIAVLTHRAVRRRQAAPLMRQHLPSTLHSRWVVAGRARQNQSWQRSRR